MSVTHKNALQLDVDLNSVSDSANGSSCSHTTKHNQLVSGRMIGENAKQTGVKASSLAAPTAVRDHAIAGRCEHSGDADAQRQQPSSRKSPRPLKLQFRCNFCRDPLRPTPWSFTEVLLALVGFRHLYCPHCFGIALRPFGVMTLLLWPLFAVWRGLTWLLGE